MITIEKCSNGFVLYRNEMEDDEVKEIDSTVYEEQGEDKKHIVALLYGILEALGEYGSKHDYERIRIIRVNQDGVEVNEHNIPESI